MSVETSAPWAFCSTMSNAGLTYDSHRDGCVHAHWPYRTGKPGEKRCGLEDREASHIAYLEDLNKTWCSCGNPSNEHIAMGYSVWCCRDCMKVICTG